jgi:hypothetical protein
MGPRCSFDISSLAYKARGKTLNLPRPCGDPPTVPAYVGMVGGVCVLFFLDGWLSLNLQSSWTA